MLPERWRRIEALFHAARDIDPSDRDVFLRERCDGDPTLRAEVEALLDAAPHAERFLARLADRTGAPFLADAGDAIEDLDDLDDPSALAGRRVGRYRPVRRIGHGGMGAVYLAERDDGQFHKRVALKLLPLGMHTGDARGRFIAERQILARLEHPGIARLLDGGVLNDGTPYLVMEYVRGEPIDAWCDARDLSVDARIDLFLQVCEAVEYAHRNLVVHRDLKPSNILVTEDGRVKLLDFGIAKVLEAGGGPDRAVAATTRMGLRPMTPEYASPEQVRGEPVTTVSDVYALGALLYRLLVGRPPLEIRTRSPAEIEALVFGREPEPPSRAYAAVTAAAATAADVGADVGAAADADADVDVATAAASSNAERERPTPASRRLRGDLDAIVLTALRKDPSERYPSAARLADDLRRYRDGRPVTARRPTLRYRLSRFLRRHRLAAAAAAVLVVLGSAYVATISVQARRIAVERDRAEDAAAFLTSVLEGLGPEQLRRARAEPRDILDGSAERVRTELRGRPLLQARLYHAIGEAYQYWGLFDDARRLLDEALAIRLRLLGPDHTAVADTRLQLGILGYRLDDPGTDSLFTAAIATYRNRLEPDHPKLRDALVNHGIALRAAGEYGAAERLFREIVAGRRGAAPAEIEHDVATALTYLGKLLTRNGEYAEAEAVLRDAIAARRGIFGDPHPVVANALDGMGELLLARGEPDAAERVFREALAMRREFFADDHPDIGVSMENLAAVERVRGGG